MTEASPPPTPQRSGSGGAVTENRNSANKAQGASPAHIQNPALRLEAGKAFVWVMVIGLMALAIYLSQSLLMIFGALVFATLIDGGARLLARVLPIGRGWRVAIVLLSAVAFLIWLALFAGTQISQQAAEFPAIIREQIERTIDWLQGKGFAIDANTVQSMAGSLLSSVGTVSKAIGGIVGGLTSVFLILIIGVYLAIDPRLYERGVAWMVPDDRRDAFYDTVSHQAYTMRRLLSGRLLGMMAEGIFTWALLGLYGVPMAALLGMLTGMLAFIPNIGAIISGILMVLVGFSGGVDMGLYAIFVYLLVQTFDGYILVPMIAKKTVDLAPALVLAAQVIFGVLFGIMGLALADPMLAMIKVALERRSQRIDGAAAARAAEAGEPEAA